VVNTRSRASRPRRTTFSNKKHHWPTDCLLPAEMIHLIQMK
jgi:hypothetical protein